MISAIFLILAGVGLGGGYLLGKTVFYRCNPAISICLTDTGLDLNGMKLKFNQEEINKFVKKYKNRGRLAEVWLWNGKTQTLERADNLPTTVKFIVGGNGKIIRGKRLEDEKGFIKVISVLGETNGKNNFIYVYFDPRTLDEVSPEVVNQEMGDILYWTIAGTAPREEFNYRLADQI